MRPFHDASCSDVLPSFLVRCTSAPAARSALTAAVCPKPAAAISGVSPLLSAHSTCAPAFNSASIAAMWPFLAASRSGVVSIPSNALGSAPAAICRSISAKSPRSAASRSFSLALDIAALRTHATPHRLAAAGRATACARRLSDGGDVQDGQRGGGRQSRHSIRGRGGTRAAARRQNAPHRARNDAWRTGVGEATGRSHGGGGASPARDRSGENATQSRPAEPRWTRRAQQIDVALTC
jgi:hypothetical protein